MKKAIALLSGGFDSLLAVRIMQKQGFEVEGLNVITPFCDTSAAAQEAAEMLGIKCHFLKTDPSYVELVRHPRYGYGKGVNPCLDCHLFMIHRAKELMEETGADVVITGEVIGQRPMSQQRHHLEMLDYHSGLKGRLIRPICGKLLPPTEAELSGLVDREQLYALSGRARTPLHQLGDELGIQKMKNSMAGCVLTETSFAPRVRDLIRHETDRTEIWEYEILRYGRHIRFDRETRVVLGRRESDCDFLSAKFHECCAAREDVTYWEPENYMGPSAMLIGRMDGETLRFAQNLQVAYSKNAVPGSILLHRYHQTEEAIEPFEPDSDFDHTKYRPV